MAKSNLPRKVGRPPEDPKIRFMRFVRVDEITGCWIWTGKLNPWGYGRFYHRGKDRQAHRVSCELFGTAIPDGLDGDHECHNRDLSCNGGITCLHRRCVNPEHIKSATEKENAARGFRSGPGKKKGCPSGHPYSAENTFIYTKKNGGEQRMCRTCNRERSRRNRYKMASARSS